MDLSSLPKFRGTSRPSLDTAAHERFVKRSRRDSLFLLSIVSWLALAGCLAFMAWILRSAASQPVLLPDSLIGKWKADDGLTIEPPDHEKIEQRYGRLPMMADPFRMQPNTVRKFVQVADEYLRLFE